jgi:glyoxylase-like metal-dependent hydrolase (beta-lactamase superfamily II)
MKKNGGMNVGWVNENFPEGLYLIDLPQNQEGFRNFLSSWFFVDSRGRRILVDPGPASTIPLLLESLSKITDAIDLVLLTHIHLDHSGGIGHLCEVFPKAKVLAHPKAVRHLTSPERLWSASLTALGGVAEMYGAPKPLDAHFMAASDEFPDIEITETLGHSPHHITPAVTADFGRLVFAGEAFGTYLPLSSGVPYLRPASPAKFDGGAARHSMDKLLGLLRDGDLVCCAHWGLVENPAGCIASAKEQLDFWVSAVSGMDGSDEEAIAEYLLANDPFMSSFSALPRDIQTRERLFMKNSVFGMVDYVEDQRKAERAVPRKDS